MPVAGRVEGKEFIAELAVGLQQSADGVVLVADLASTAVGYAGELACLVVAVVALEVQAVAVALGVALGGGGACVAGRLPLGEGPGFEASGFVPLLGVAQAVGLVGVSSRNGKSRTPTVLHVTHEGRRMLHVTTRRPAWHMLIQEFRSTATPFA